MEASEFKFNWQGNDIRVVVSGDVVSIPGWAGNPGWSMGGFGADISVEWLMHEGGLPGPKGRKLAYADMIRRALAKHHGGTGEPSGDRERTPRGPYVRCGACKDSGMQGYVLDLPRGAAGVRDGWTLATEEIPMDDEEIVIDPGDWIWRDEEGRIRRTYGWAGGSYERAHTFDAQGRCVLGVEARDEESVPMSDLKDKDGIHPKWRAVVEKYRIEMADAIPN